MAALWKRQKAPGPEVGGRRTRAVVVGLDGVPHSLLTRLIDRGELPVLARLAGEGDLIRFNSVQPTISSVAWATFMTGVNPAQHGIFGFIDRTLSPFRMVIQTARDMRAETLWEYLGRHGRRVVVINVPVTFPPREVNGILVGGFLGTDVGRIAWPPEVCGVLERMGYIIDVDPWLGRQPDKRPFLRELERVLDRRFDAARHFIASAEWDYFHCHVMETDRLMHFLWGPMEEGHPEYRDGFMGILRRIDGHLGGLLERAPGDAELVVLSDHGFCGVKQEVQLNRWLEETGYLVRREGEDKGLALVAPESKAYSLIPGRIFINLRGREPIGSVDPGEAYESLRREIGARLETELVDPDTGERVIERVVTREALYDGPLLERAADLVAVPVDGYDLKARFDAPAVFERTGLSGMHTFDDAFLYVRGRQLARREGASIADLFPTIAGGLFGLPVEELGLDGVSLIEGG